MHIVFGGVFNGKTDYVKRIYKPDVFVTELAANETMGNTIAITNFQLLVKPFLQLDEVEASDKVFEQIARLNEQNEVICICDDVSRGVVPMDTNERKMRDVLGRLYQQLFENAQTVTRIWYGIPERIK
ncbi:MAG: bifunctional adenosylcobinamide kinase/adenosylcobinamide-phosphate guanylyltransferase [Lysinibacillus sp.]